MEIIPAIDLKDGVCVRLRQGREDSVIEYSSDPAAVASDWERRGATRLHIVNLDGAFGRASRNSEVLREIAEKTEVLIEFGGGLRSREEIEAAFKAGAGKAVLGTVAVESPDLLTEVLEQFGRNRIIVALDGKAGRVAIRGWQDVTDIPVLDLCRRMVELGVNEVLYTDIERDGMLTGPDLSTLKDLATLGIPVIASGGVSSVEDVQSILDLESPSISGIIVGKALYENKVSLEQLLEITRGNT